MRRALLGFAVLLGALHAQAALDLRIQGAQLLPLSIAQEAEEAIERAQTWLAAQGAPTNAASARLLYRYALASEQRPFTLSRCDLTPLTEIMPKATEAALLTNLTAALAQSRDNPRALFALQRDLPEAQPPPPDYWREALALALINTQKIDRQGGHWGSREASIWALLTLRALLNESAPIRIKGE